MSKAGHTATPWRVGFNDGSGEKYINAVKGERGLPQTVAVVRWGCSCCEASGELTETQKANAAFIVLAVNNHDSLVSALRKVRVNLVNRMGIDSRWDEWLSEQSRAIGSVLSNVTGGE